MWSRGVLVAAIVLTPLIACGGETSDDGAPSATGATAPVEGGAASAGGFGGQPAGGTTGPGGSTQVSSRCEEVTTEFARLTAAPQWCLADEECVRLDLGCHGDADCGHWVTGDTVRAVEQLGTALVECGQGAANCACLRLVGQPECAGGRCREGSVGGCVRAPAVVLDPVTKCQFPSSYGCSDGAEAATPQRCFFDSVAQVRILTFAPTDAMAGDRACTSEEEAAAIEHWTSGSQCELR